MSDVIVNSGIAGYDAKLKITVDNLLCFKRDGESSWTQLAGGGSSGGTEYSAGTGISISGGVISINSATVALKSDLTSYSAGTGISISGGVISINSATVALKTDIPVIDVNTTILGNAVNVANGLVQLGTDGKIPASLYDLSGITADSILAEATVTTTLGKNWSTSNTQAQYTDSNSTRRVVTAPTANKLNIVFSGASVTYGEGVSTYYGWLKRLTKDLGEGNYGYNCLIRAVGGNGIGDQYKRMYTDVIPYNPDYLVVGFEIVNEALLKATQSDSMVMIKNVFDSIGRLGEICRQNRIKLIVLGPYGFGTGFTPASYPWITPVLQTYIQWLNNNADIERLDWLGATYDDEYRAISSVYTDVNHPNDTGHTEMSYLWNRDIFRAISAGRRAPKSFNGNKSYIRFDSTAAGTAAVLKYTPNWTIGSWTTAFEFKKFSAETTEYMLYSQQGLTVKVNAAGKIVAAVGATSATSTATYDFTGFRRLFITYSNVMNKVVIYVDGVAALTLNTTLAAGKDAKYFAGSAAGSVAAPQSCGFRNVVIYRSYFRSLDAKLDYAGTILCANLDVVSPCDDQLTYANSIIRNDGLSTGFMETLNAVMTPVQVLNESSAGSGSTAYTAGSGIDITENVIGVSAEVTKQGNTFNAANSLVKLDANGKIPTDLYNAGTVGGGTEYTAGTGISISNYAVSIDASVVALKTDIPTINPNTTILGNSVNVANGLVQLGSDGKIPTALYEAGSGGNVDVNSQFVVHTVSTPASSSIIPLSINYYINRVQETVSGQLSIGFYSITDRTAAVQLTANQIMTWEVWVTATGAITGIVLNGPNNEIPTVGIDLPATLEMISGSTKTVHVFVARATYKSGNTNNAKIAVSYAYSFMEA